MPGKERIPALGQFPDGTDRIDDLRVAGRFGNKSAACGCAHFEFGLGHVFHSLVLSHELVYLSHRFTDIRIQIFPGRIGSGPGSRVFDFIFDSSTILGHHGPGRSDQNQKKSEKPIDKKVFHAGMDFAAMTAEDGFLIRLFMQDFRQGPVHTF